MGETPSKFDGGLAMLSEIAQAKPQETGGVLSGPDVGMSWKEVGEGLRSGFILKCFGADYEKKIRLVYWGYIFNTVGIKLADEK